MGTVEAKEITFLSHKILELNKQLIESEKAKSRFLSLIASELNNPMTTLLGMIPHLAPPSGNPHESIFKIVDEEILSLNSRIQNIVAASEIESGVIDLSYASVNPMRVIEEALEACKYKLKYKNIVVSIENTLDEKIISDPKKLYLILKNIIANACDYGDAENTINIEINHQEFALTIAITNQGHAPNVKFKPQVFTRFANTMEGNHGLGLGLSVARELCEQMDGTIDYESDGTSVTFSVTLPFQETPADSDACGSNEFLFESFDDAVEL